eukprot:gnl/TRDRNA2_/TRDRNA2_160201_c1_seq1.p1 gnl/TRDRNA2_/TRDRNA2_160201_c1~~gnl/TRDRNA2_/TRDRNA2_160201_c1_seq1.p1  ORF type:complete len:240 (-),score=40.29 gnl/TRDRNA2_/TRDRNA2_160201_c1_seq1:40-678(-)
MEVRPANQSHVPKSNSEEARDRMQEEHHRQFLSKEFFGSPNALFTPVSAFSMHPYEMEMMISPGMIYEVLSIFTFPPYVGSQQDSGEAAADVTKKKKAKKKKSPAERQRKRQYFEKLSGLFHIFPDKKQQYFENAFSPIDARLTELFLGSEGVQDVKWTRNLVAALKREERLLRRLKGVVIVKVRDPNKSASKGASEGRADDSAPNSARLRR